MDWRAITFDWNQIRAFLVTAEEGSFSAASRALGLTQPTLGRQVAAIEGHLGVTLFERGGRGLSLTQSGVELLEHVRVMGEAANRVTLTASGQAQSIEGHVRITAVDSLAIHFLPPAIKRMREQAPGISIEIVASNDVQDLHRREADIAVRHARPRQPDLIAKFIRDLPMRLYATTAFLDRIGRPKHTDDLSRLDFVAFDRTARFSESLKQMGLKTGVRSDDTPFSVTSENGAVAWAMVRNGIGIGIMAEEIACTMPDMECAFPDLDPMMVPVWLVTHRELKTSRRIRLVFDALSDALA